MPSGEVLKCSAASRFQAPSAEAICQTGRAFAGRGAGAGGNGSTASSFALGSAALCGASLEPRSLSIPGEAPTNMIRHPGDSPEPFGGREDLHEVLVELGARVRRGGKLAGSGLGEPVSERVANPVGAGELAAVRECPNPNFLVSRVRRDPNECSGSEAAVVKVVEQEGEDPGERPPGRARPRPAGHDGVDTRFAVGEKPAVSVRMGCGLEEGPGFRPGDVVNVVGRRPVGGGDDLPMVIDHYERPSLAEGVRVRIRNPGPISVYSAKEMHRHAIVIKALAQPPVGPLSRGAVEVKFGLREEARADGT